MNIYLNDDQKIFEKYAELLSEELPSNEAQYKTKNVTLEDMSYLINHLDPFIAAFPNGASKNFIIYKLSELIVGFGLVHKVSSEDRDYSSEDFPHTAHNAVKCFQCLKTLCKELRTMDHGFKQKFLITVLILCATHSKIYHWSSKESVSLCEEFVIDIFQFTEHSNLTSLLCDKNFHPTIVKGMLRKIRPSLMKDSWMLNPSICYLFYWILSNVKHPHLVEYVSDVFPPPFMFVSYHAVKQKVLGIQCFNHMLDNVPPTFWKLHGKEDAIFNSLYPLTYSKDIPVIEVLFPCLLKLPMMKSTKNRTGSLWTKNDKILNHLLSTVEFENNPSIKKMYLSHIKDFVECSPPYKHLKHLIKLVKIFLMENKLIILKILKEVIKSCWPRMQIHCFDILTSVFDLLLENDVLNNAEINQLIEECLTLLKFSCKEKFVFLTSSYVENPDLPGAELIKQIIEKED